MPDREGEWTFEIGFLIPEPLRPELYALVAYRPDTDQFFVLRNARMQPQATEPTPGIEPDPEGSGGSGTAASPPRSEGAGG
jgi:hypothetical protein